MSTVSMIRIIAVCFAVLAVAIGLLVWRMQASVLYSQPLSAKYKLTIRSVGQAADGKNRLEITYHYPPAIGMYTVAHQTINRLPSNISFSHIVDHEGKIQCVYDNNGIGFLLLYYEPSDDLWDSTERNGGWNGTEDSLWQQRLEDLRLEHPSIPYANLPGRN